MYIYIYIYIYRVYHKTLFQLPKLLKSTKVCPACGSGVRKVVVGLLDCFVYPFLCPCGEWRLLDHPGRRRSRIVEVLGAEHLSPKKANLLNYNRCIYKPQNG